MIPDSLNSHWLCQFSCLLFALCFDLPSLVIHTLFLISTLLKEVFVSFQSRNQALLIVFFLPLFQLPVQFPLFICKHFYFSGSIITIDKDNSNMENCPKFSSNKKITEFTYVLLQNKFKFNFNMEILWQWNHVFIFKLGW